MQVFCAVIAVMAFCYIAYERIFPVTRESIMKMHFKEIVEYLENLPVVDHQDQLADLAVKRGINIWSRVTDGDLTLKFRAVLAMQKREAELKRFDVRLIVTSYGELEPNDDLVMFA